MEQCIDELEQKRINIMLKPGAKNTELPESLEEATMAMLAAELSSEIEAKIFTGDSAVNTYEFDGAVKTLKGSADAIKIKGATLTKANVLGEIEKVYEAIPENVLVKGLENDTIKIYVSYETMQRAKMALAGVSNQVVSAALSYENNELRYIGVEIVPVKGLDNATMIAAESTNMLLVTDLLSDLEEIRIGQFPAPNDSKLFIDGRLRLGFAIPFENEVVFYAV